MVKENTNWGQSVTAIVIRCGKVLLARHTYGDGRGMLIAPGGYVEYGETPQAAIIREFREETGVDICLKEVIAIRFNMHDWYVAFSADYITGTPCSDNDENSEVVWLDIDEALSRQDVAQLTKSLIKCAQNPKKGLDRLSYEGNPKNGESSLYGII